MEFALNLAKSTPAPETGSGLLVIACGMRKEALLAGYEEGITVIACGGNPVVLQDGLDALDPGEIAAVISFGIAGALDPALEIGDVIVPDAVVTRSKQRFEADPRILKAWRKRLPEPGLHGEARSLVGTDRPALTRQDKHDLRRLALGASAVDMESHVAAAYAARHERPFAALRVISDGAGQELPPAARNALREDGSVNLGAVIGAVIRRPGQIPALLETGRNAKTAFEALGRVRGLLGRRFGLDL